MGFRFRRRILALAALCLTGCATSPVSTAEAEKVSASDQFATPFRNSALITVTRDSGFGGSACSSTVLMDGHEAGSLRTGQGLFLYVGAGEHIVGVRTPGICGGGTSEASVTVNAGDEKGFRTGRDSAGGVFLTRTAF